MYTTGDNVFVSFLELLKVKHTKEFSNQYFNEHPHKYNLFGISKMLSEYGIENAAIRITDKEKDILEIETPFIAHFGGDFAVAYQVEANEISFLWRGNKHVLPALEFANGWSGVVLLAETSEKSIEPDYEGHRKIERLNFLKKTLLFSACSLILLLAYISRSLYTDLGISILLLLNLSGIYVSWLLLLKQMHIQSQYADKICSLFKQNDCNNILESKAAKLWGVIGWSEIGLGYFSTNLLILLFFPSLVTYIALINILTLPYSFWSVWYQKVKAKQWCVLCLIVQVLLWMIFIINYLFDYIQLTTFGYSVTQLFSSIILGSCYLALVLGINILVPKLNADRMISSLRQAVNGIKANENVFKALLKQQPYYKTNDCDSIIRFGNPDSPLKLTIFSNPYCNPCSRIHKRIEWLLQKVSNNISVQYILSSFNESLNSTNKYLMAVCLANNNGNIRQIFTDWFEKGRMLKDDFFKSLHLDMENPEIEVEFQKHEAWKEKTQLRATPTILLNGYQLPENYKIDDLQYFTEFNVEVK